MRSESMRALLLALFAVAAFPQARPLTILHTNDLHARFTPLDNHLGGFPYLATAIRRERENCKQCILLNAGDLAQGSPVSTIFHGLPIFEVANLLHFDAATLGNHDFDYGWMQARKFIETANYPIVSANLVNDSGELFTKHPYIILKVNGLRVAVIGAMTEELRTLEYAGVARSLARVPRHRGSPQGRREGPPGCRPGGAARHTSPAAEELDILHNVPEVNVVVSGHVHAGLEREVVDGHRMVVRVRGDSEELGRLDLQVNAKEKEIESWKWTRLSIDSTKLAPAADVAAQVKKWEDEVTRRVDQPLAVAKHAIDKAGLKTLMERAMCEQTGAQFAFMNLGGIRDVLPGGQLLVRHIWNIMPFDNTVVFGKFKGKDLPKVVTGGRTVEPEREYTLAVTDFTAANQGARSQLQSAGLEFPGQGPLLRDLLVDWFRKQQTIQ